MESITINIINPKAIKLLKDLEELGLISINRSESLTFKEVLTKIRDNSVEPPDLDEITREVEAIRTKRYGEKKR
jgi:hypothetical protein